MLQSGIFRYSLFQFLKKEWKMCLSSTSMTVCKKEIKKQKGTKREKARKEGFRQREKEKEVTKHLDVTTMKTTMRRTMSKLKKIRFNETQTYWLCKYSIYLTWEYRLYLETTNPTFNRFNKLVPVLCTRVVQCDSQTNESFDMIIRSRSHHRKAQIWSSKFSQSVTRGMTFSNHGRFSEYFTLELCANSTLTLLNSRSNKSCCFL